MVIRGSENIGTFRFLAGCALIVVFFLMAGCKTPLERRKEAAHLDSLRNDSARPALNPYKPTHGNEIYNNERENLGNLDSMVTPQQPALPNR